MRHCRAVFPEHSTGCASRSEHVMLGDVLPLCPVMHHQLLGGARHEPPMRIASPTSPCSARVELWARVKPIALAHNVALQEISRKQLQALYFCIARVAKKSIFIVPSLVAARQFLFRSCVSCIPITAAQDAALMQWRNFQGIICVFLQRFTGHVRSTVDLPLLVADANVRHPEFSLVPFVDLLVSSCGLTLINARDRLLPTLAKPKGGAPMGGWRSRGPNVHILGFRNSKTPPKSNEKTPKGGKKECCGGRGKKRAKFWAVRRWTVRRRVVRRSPNPQPHQHQHLQKWSLEARISVPEGPRRVGAPSPQVWGFRSECWSFGLGGLGSLGPENLAQTSEH